ncbi:hypothetical protein SAMN05216266_12945 [Amycolatopsis marina]|uniref:Proteins of 100 residues with WXG n=1 Tax=Amycolatopsis marina TaxID=490629 RepID=A0A1I1CM09_9PSEU|nr:hypothetical protein [Amycolatopsis marina]SFB61958.1 hypothetical protein SAMN05216266_12945 [Amycolatopsis marina]
MAEASGFWTGVTATEQVQKVFGGAVGGIAAGATLGPAGNASWEFDPDEIDSVISKWKALRDDVVGDRDAIRDMLEMAIPPSGDDPSGTFVGDLQESLRSLLESNVSMLAYIQNFVEKLETAKAGIEAKDEENSNPFQAVGGSFNV